MQTVCLLADDSHEMSRLVFFENKILFAAVVAGNVRFKQGNRSMISWSSFSRLNTDKIEEGIWGILGKKTILILARNSHDKD